MKSTTTIEPVVYVVDDDAAVRDSLGLLLESVGLACQVCESAAEFLELYTSDSIGCLVTDVRMPGMTGLELQQELIQRQIRIPVIFITGHGDVPMAVKAMKEGARDFLTKPFDDQDLVDRIRAALADASDQFDSLRRQREVRSRYESLTPRESEVMTLVVQGCANKIIAMDLGLSQRTVELHRARVMHKMQVRSLAELVRLSELLEPEPQFSDRNN